MTRGPGTRRGFTLIDLLITMFVFTAFMGLCVALIELVLKLDSGGQEHLEAMETSARLARIFRADAHASTGASQGSGPGPGSPRDRLILSFPGGQTVEYRAWKGDVVRAERRGDEVVRNDRFRIPARSAELLLEVEGDRRVAAVVIDRRTVKKRGGPRTLKIEATLGSDHRHEEGALP